MIKNFCNDAQQHGIILQNIFNSARQYMFIDFFFQNLITTITAIKSERKKPLS